MREANSVDLSLLILLAIIQLIMAIFTIGIISSKLSKNESNNFYFNERRNYISPFALILTFSMLVIIFFPKQEKIEFTNNEIKILFGTSILGLLNNTIY